MSPSSTILMVPSHVVLVNTYLLSLFLTASAGRCPKPIPQCAPHLPTPLSPEVLWADSTYTRDGRAGLVLALHSMLSAACPRLSIDHLSTLAMMPFLFLYSLK